MMHYKKNELLWRAKNATKAQKSAAKGTFDLQRRVLLQWFFPPLLRCYYRSIAVIPKNAAINLSFSGSFGLLWRVDNHRHIRLEFESIDLKWRVISAVIGLHIEQNICTFERHYMCEALATGYKRRYRASIIS